MNQALNPLSMEWEECTKTTPPHFEHDSVRVADLLWQIDTCDVDGDDNYCRIRRHGFAATMIVPVEMIGKRGVTIFAVLNANDRFLDALLQRSGS